MSKERELLKAVWEDLDGDRNNYNGLCEKIEELLAQPEKKPKPLSDGEILKIATKVCLEDMGIEMNPKDFKDTGVFELSRAIEKSHGIGVDDGALHP